MAMDNFLEEVATKRNRGVETVMYIFANILMGVFAVLAFMYLTSIQGALSQGATLVQILIGIGLPLVVTGGFAVLLFLYRDRIRTEYEYTFTNGQMDFAQVFNNKKRKNLGTLHLRNIDACGLVASGSFKRYVDMSGLKRIHWFLNRDAELLYFYFQKDGQKKMIIIEPSEEMIGMIKKGLAQGAWQIN